MNFVPNVAEAMHNESAHGDGDPKTNKERYRLLKRRFKFLVYENECYQEELRNLQRKLLKLSRDKNFLLDRLLPYEKLSESSDDSDASVTKAEDKKPKNRKPRAPQQRKRPSAASSSGVGAPMAGGAVPPVSGGAAKMANEIHASMAAATAQHAQQQQQQHDVHKANIEDLVSFPSLATGEQQPTLATLQATHTSSESGMSLGPPPPPPPLPVSCGPVAASNSGGGRPAPAAVSAASVGPTPTAGGGGQEAACTPAGVPPSGNNVMSAPPADLLQC